MKRVGSPSPSKLNTAMRPTSPAKGLTQPSRFSRPGQGSPGCVNEAGLTKQNLSPSHLRSSQNAPRQQLSSHGLTSSAAEAHDATRLPLSGRDMEGLAEYILTGPLITPCGISVSAVRDHLDDWVCYGQRLAQQLGLDHDNLNAEQRLRIYQYYLPVFFWVEGQLAKHKAAAARRGETPSALVLGISAPQGCGKTTLVEQLEALFNATGRKAASVSIDDFYLSFNDQTALAKANAGNRLLELRGNAGTHDLKLGSDTLKNLQGLNAAGRTAAVPRYDKSAEKGRGDRASESSWPQVEGPLDVLLFEGWMSGFSPVSEAQAAAVDPSLVEVNRLLQDYLQAWDGWVDSWLVVRIGDPQAEVEMQAKGKAGMTEEQVADFVDRFMPAYHAYLPGLYARGPSTARAGRTLVIEVDASRTPVVQQPPPPQLTS